MSRFSSYNRQSAIPRYSTSARQTLMPVYIRNMNQKYRVLNMTSIIDFGRSGRHLKTALNQSFPANFTQLENVHDLDHKLRILEMV
jgi:hypothetical protein